VQQITEFGKIKNLYRKPRSRFKEERVKEVCRGRRKNEIVEEGK